MWRIGGKGHLQRQEKPAQHWERKRGMKTEAKAALDCEGSGGCRGRAILTGADQGPSQSCQKEESCEPHA